MIPRVWRLPALEAWLSNPQELLAVIGDQNLAAPHLNQSLSATRQLADSSSHCLIPEPLKRRF